MKQGSFIFEVLNDLSIWLIYQKKTIFNKSYGIKLFLI